MSSERNVILSFVVVSLALIGGIVLLVMSQPEPIQITVNPPAPTVTPPPTATASPLLIYVTGAVAEPEQTVSLPPESRVSDAIEAAGGTTENADLTRVNLAGVLRDGDQVHVPVIEAVEAEPVITATASGGGIIPINSATIDELQTLPGIGPALAERIIAYREENGPFADVEALDAVSGIGPALLEGLDGLIVFD